MTLRACRVVPSMIFALVIGGCFDSYGADRPATDGGGSARDSGHGASDSSHGASDAGPIASDAGPIASDAGPIANDAGADCEERALDLACFDQVRAGVPAVISIVAGGIGDECFCEQTLGCTASIAGDRVLAISTSICPATPVCRACEDIAEGSCELPALTEGTWRVVVNGRDSHELEVLPAGVIAERGAVCIRRAIVDRCGAIWPPAGFAVARACHDEAASVGARVPIRVYDACGGCQQRGPCRVQVLDDVIRVQATRMSNACEIACPPACFDDEHLCLTPPLEAGTYRVVIDGLSVSVSTTLQVAPGAGGPEVCAGG